MRIKQRNCLLIPCWTVNSWMKRRFDFTSLLSNLMATFGESILYEQWLNTPRKKQFATSQTDSFMIYVCVCVFCGVLVLPC